MVNQGTLVTVLPILFLITRLVEQELPTSHARLELCRIVYYFQCDHVKSTTRRQRSKATRGWTGDLCTNLSLQRGDLVLVDLKLTNFCRWLTLNLLFRYKYEVSKDLRFGTALSCFSDGRKPPSYRSPGPSGSLPG